MISLTTEHPVQVKRGKIYLQEGHSIDLHKCLRLSIKGINRLGEKVSFLSVKATSPRDWDTRTKRFSLQHYVGEGLALNRRTNITYLANLQANLQNGYYFLGFVGYIFEVVPLGGAKDIFQSCTVARTSIPNNSFILKDL